ncbi:MAG: hypothetical protein MUQ32_03260 [Chloroflexi bacterium]|nr:hypothetical protein [Chloroflexota bacterium]
MTDNVIVSAGGDRVAGWYDDHGGSLFASANANDGSGNRYWIGAPEPTSYRFEWNGGRSTLAAYNATRGDEGASYLTKTQRDAILGAAGVPDENGARPPAPAPRAGDPRITVGGKRLGSGVVARISWSRVSVANA